MGMCRKCNSPMVVKGTRMVCEKCDYSYDVPVKLPNYDDLLSENRKLLHQVDVLEKALAEQDELLQLYLPQDH